MDQRSRPPKSTAACMWCGTTDAVTDDHCPPKGLFPRRVHYLVPTVPGCRRCNGGWQSDSEYLRDALVVLLENSKHPDLTEIRAAHERAVRHRIERGKAPSIFHDRSDLSRVNHIMIQITAKLHAYTDLPPVGPELTCFADYADPVTPVFATVRQLIAERHESSAGGLFKWRYKIDESDRRQSEWLLSFYDEAIFRVQSVLMGKEPLRSLFLGPIGPIGTYKSLDFRLPHERNKKQ